MTRVEKYRRYREEIANMKFESSSSKKTVSESVGKIRDINETSTLDYMEVLNAFEIYDTEGKETKKHHKFHIRKNQIIYCVIAFIVIVILILLIVLKGIDLWKK